jgi:hypothetical protein
MAKRKSRSKPRKNKIEPSVLTLSFVTPVLAPGASGTHTIDLSQVASLVNRRFYRQGLNWAVSGFKVFTAQGQKAGITIQKLPNTWIMSNSWEKAFRTWTEMNNKALEENESVKPRFHDFKIYADSTHHLAGEGQNLLPFNLDGAGTPVVALPGDWDYSTIHVPDTGATQGANVSNIQRVVHEFDMIATGASYPGAGASGNDAVSLIEGYAASRALPNVVDPNTPDDARAITGPEPANWLSAIFNEGLIQDSEIIRDMQTQNEIAPYPFENDGTNLDTMYPGGANQLPGLEIHDRVLVSTTTIGGQTYLKGGNFPCGLIRFSIGNDPTSISAGLSIQIDLVPGNHRGYLCEPMTEM